MTHLRCGHCGRQGTLERVEDVLVSSRTVEVGEGMYADEIDQQQRVLIQRCSVCQGLTFSMYVWIDQFSEPGDDLDGTVLYPRDLEVDDLPIRVGQRYSEMLELLFAPDAFAVRAGRLLEAVCSDLGIAEGELHRRLEQLARDDRLPRSLADQALLVKEYRNVGGHDDEMDVSDDDVPLVRGFVEALLEFLYWGPAKLARATDEFERRKAAKRTER